MRAFHRRSTPLHNAALNHKYDVVRLLVANGADVAARDTDGSAEYSRRRCTVGVVLPRGTAGGDCARTRFLTGGAILGDTLGAWIVQRCGPHCSVACVLANVSAAHNCTATPDVLGDADGPIHFGVSASVQEDSAGKCCRRGRVRRGRQSASDRSAEWHKRCPRGSIGGIGGAGRTGRRARERPDPRLPRD